MNRREFYEKSFEAVAQLAQFAQLAQVAQAAQLALLLGGEQTPPNHLPRIPNIKLEDQTLSFIHLFTLLISEWWCCI